MEHASKLAEPSIQTDDIASLKAHLPARRFDYVDVAAGQAHKEVLRRWALLAELDAWRKDAGMDPDAATAVTHAGTTRAAL